MRLSSPTGFACWVWGGCLCVAMAWPLLLWHSQFQKGEVGIAVVFLVFALRCNIVLEDGRRLWVVTIQSVENCINVLWPLGRVIKRDSHYCCCRGIGDGQTNCAEVGASSAQNSVQSHWCLALHFTCYCNIPYGNHNVEVTS